MPERRLWMTVLALAIEDLRAGIKVSKKDVVLLCALAGIDVELTEKLRKRTCYLK